MNSEAAKREKKRAEIMEAAFRLFLQKGYANTKIIEIANSAKIGKGTVYEYFKSKDQILLDIILKYVKNEFIQLSGRINEARSLQEKLRAYIDFEMEFVGKYGMYALEIKKTVLASTDTKISGEICKAIYDVIEAEHRNILQIVEYGLKKGQLRSFISSTVTARFIVGVVGTYAAIRCGLPNELGFSGTEEEGSFFSDRLLEQCTPDDIIDLILHGVGV